MLAGAVTHYLTRYAVRAGNTAVLVTNNDDSYSSLAGWRAAGIALAAIMIRGNTGPNRQAARPHWAFPVALRKTCACRDAQPFAQSPADCKRTCPGDFL